MVLPAFSFLPTPIYFIPDITRVLKKTITKTSSVSCVTELVSYKTLAINIANYSTYAVNLASLQLGINEPEWLEYLKLVFLENIKYSTKLDFLRSSHIYNYTIHIMLAIVPKMYFIYCSSHSYCKCDCPQHSNSGSVTNTAV